MRKLIVCLLATACVGLADAQFKADQAVGLAGQDPATPKAMAVQGITGGKDIPVTVPGPITIDQPVSVVDDSGNAVANAANQDWIINNIGGATGVVGNGVTTRAMMVGFSDPSNDIGFADIDANNDQEVNVKTMADLSGNSIGARAILDGTEWSAVGAYTAAQTDAVIKSCPAGKRLVLTGMMYNANGTVLIELQDEDDVAAMIPVDCVGSGSGAVFPGTKDAPIWIGATDKDLEVDTNAAIRHGVQLKGYIID